LTRLWRPALAVTFMAAVLLLLGRAELWLAVPAGTIAYSGILVITGGLRIRPGRMPLLRV
jgi:hypothetical protein